MKLKKEKISREFSRFLPKFQLLTNVRISIMQIIYISVLINLTSRPL